MFLKQFISENNHKFVPRFFSAILNHQNSQRSSIFSPTRNISFINSLSSDTVPIKLPSNRNFFRNNSSNILQNVNYSWVDHDGKVIKQCKGLVGENLLDSAKKHGVFIEAACEGAVSCGTCHVVLQPKLFKKLTEMSDSEEDLLDVVPGLSEYSRLACGLKITPEFEGAKIMLPRYTRTMAVDGAKLEH